MTARIYPVDAVGGLPTNPGRALRQTAVAPFVTLGSTARPLGALSGVRPGTPSTIGTVTSTTWTVNPFAGVLDGEALAIAGPYTYAFDTAQTGAVNASGASARTDRLDVQINDSAESDGTPTTTPAFAQIVYTPGSSITPPAAPARSHPLFLINVPATGGGSPTLTWNASFTAAAGAFADFLTLAALKLWTTAPAWQHATVIADPTSANNGDYVWNGSAWTAMQTASIVPVTTFGAGFTTTAAPNSARILRTGNSRTLYGEATFGTGSSYSNVLTVPTADQPPTTTSRVIGIGGIYSGAGSLILARMTIAAGVVGFSVSSASAPVGTVYLAGLTWLMD